MHTHSCDHKDCCHAHDVFHADTDHDARLEAARALCTERGVRFTPLRQEVYALILAADKPMGAYDLIAALQARRDAEYAAQAAPKRQKASVIAPPTVYRSLDFLLAEGFIHQLNSINAYIPCCHPRDAHAAAFLICTLCQKVTEYSRAPVHELMDFIKDDVGFSINQSYIELKGICDDCRAN